MITNLISRNCKLAKEEIHKLNKIKSIVFKNDWVYPKQLRGKDWQRWKTRPWFPGNTQITNTPNLCPG